MAVEARHLNLFPPQFAQNKDLINSAKSNLLGFNAQIGSSSLPLAAAMPETFLPINPSLFCDSAQAPKTSVNTDSGLTFNIPASTTVAASSRKRSRESLEPFISSALSISVQTTEKHGAGVPFSQVPSLPAGHEILSLVQQYQSAIDHLVAQHTKKMRMEIEEQQKQQARFLIAAIGEGVGKKLKEKEDQIQKIGRLNLVLQERVKSLYVENQLWRDMAQTNEATANSLRTNLEQVLAQVSDERVSVAVAGGRTVAAGVEEEVESCCGSTTDDAERKEEEEEEEVDGRRTLAGEAQGKEICGTSRRCKRCGVKESCVLLLPCRHLCLCTACGSTLLQTCPVCYSSMNATVHVNMS